MCPNQSQRKNPDKKWEHYKLWCRVKEALLSLPGHFKISTFIEGMSATDIFTLNTALGATIESQVVDVLNEIRPVWDPDKKYLSYHFVRQAQIFPDVLLRKKTNGADILMGIELKGWYILSKEGAPNFRFTVNKDACEPQDLIAIFPWALSNVLSGSPKIFSPFLESSLYCAKERNCHWKKNHKKGIKLAENVTPYPDRKSKISDRPEGESDGGGNFGRLARYNVMDEYIKQTMKTNVCGVQAKAWANFFKECTEANNHGN